MPSDDTLWLDEGTRSEWARALSAASSLQGYDLDSLAKTARTNLKAAERTIARQHVKQFENWVIENSSKSAKKVFNYVKDFPLGEEVMVVKGRVAESLAERLEAKRHIWVYKWSQPAPQDLISATLKKAEEEARKNIASLRGV